MPAEKNLSVSDSVNTPTMAPQRVMRLIEALAQSREGLTLTQLCSHTGLPKTSLFSLLRSLSDGGFVISEGKTHRLGPETYRIAAVIHRTDQFPGSLHSLLETLQNDCNETVMVGVPTEDWLSLVYVDVIESSSGLRFSINIGAHRPMYSTTVGKIMLAYATDEQRIRYLNRTELVPQNAQTVTSGTSLLKELDAARKKGYIFSSGSVDGATGVAAPIFGPGQQLVGAVGAAGPSERFKRQRDSFAKLITQCGREMSAKLGYAGVYPRKSVNQPG